MRFRANPASRIERVASLATAIGVTIGIALLVVAAPGRLLRVSRLAPAIEDRQVSEHVVFVAPLTPVLAVERTRQAARSVRAEARPADTTSAREQVMPRVDSASLAPAVDDPRPTTPTRSSGSPPAKAGAPVAGAMAGFRRPSVPIRFDSVNRAYSESLATGLATGHLTPPPLTQAELDAKWRAEAFDAVASRGVGDPVRRAAAVGGSIPVPLPFGGPSRKQRERDRAIYAELKATMVLRQARVDSAIAARKRRRADSLARVADSLRLGTRP